LTQCFEQRHCHPESLKLKLAEGEWDEDIGSAPLLSGVSRDSRVEISHAVCEDLPNAANTTADMLNG
jgi:hypothetical protein